MEEDGEDLTPFWVQSTTNRSRTDRNGFSSFFFSSGLLIILLLVTAVFFLVFIVPSTLSFSAQIFKPNSIKKSWDSLNVVLVIFALVFGFLSRATTINQASSTINGDDYHQTSSPISSKNEIQRSSNPSTPQRKWYNEDQRSNPSTPQRKWYHYSMNEDQRKYLSAFQRQQQWSGYSDQNHQMAYNQVNSSRGGLTRATSSYPDLLEASSEFNSGDDSWRFYDDMTVNTSQASDSGQFLRRRSWKDKFEVPRVAENMSIDTFVNLPKEASSPPLPRPPSPPPTAPSLPSPPSLSPRSSPSMPKDERPKLAHRNRERRRKRNEKDNEMENRELPISSSSQVTPPPPSPPEFMDQKISKTDKKRSGGNATQDFLNSLYRHNKKKKKQRQKSIESFDFSLLYQSQIPQSPQQAPPPPPPSSVFHNLFSSKKSKRKKPDPNISAPKLSQPETLIPTSKINSISKPSISQITTITTKKPIKVRSFDSVEENSNSGGESPVIPIPPPPPPFAKSLSWKFVVQGDYVRVDSNLSSRSGSPDIDDVESSEGTTPTAETDGGGDDATSSSPPSPLFFPSPDVNTKAENFITSFRAGLKLEKIDSVNKRQVPGLSNLGRGSGPTRL